MRKPNIALIFGSVDSEHSVSIKTARSIFSNFPRDAYACTLIYIQKDGRWITGDFDDSAFEAGVFEGEELLLRFDPEHPGFFNQKTQQPLYVDAAFIALHGPTGEGGFIQGLLDMAFIPYTGSDVLASVTSMDKAITHLICEEAGIKMAPYQLVESFDAIDHSRIEYPVIVKPSREGSSYGVGSAHDREGLKAACEYAFKFDSRILIEKLIRGSEAALAVLKTRDASLVSHPSQTVIQEDFFNFDSKYVNDTAVTYYDALYPPEVKDQLRDLALKIFDIMSCRHLARLDFFVTDDHEIYFNEVNTMPGFTSTSFYPTLMRGIGVEYTDLLKRILDEAITK